MPGVPSISIHGWSSLLRTCWPHAWQGQLSDPPAVINTSRLETRKILIKTSLPSFSFFLCLFLSPSLPPSLPLCWIHTFEDLKSFFAFTGIIEPTTVTGSTKASSYQIPYLWACVSHKIWVTLRIRQFKSNFVQQFPSREPCFTSPPSSCQSRSLC